MGPLTATIALDTTRADSLRRVDPRGALADVAVELGRHADPVAVMSAVCRHARRLVGADVAYISVVDAATRDERIAALDGEQQDVGLGGDAPLAKRSVLASDPRLLVSIPLKDSDRPIGELVTAGRAEYQIDREGEELLEQLAALAALALERASLVRGAQRDAAELSRAAAVGELQDRLTALEVRGAGQQAMLDAIREALGGADVTLHDTRPTDASALADVVWMPIAVGDDVLAWLRSGTSDNLDAESRAALLDRGAAAIGRDIVRARDRAETASRRRDEMLEQILDGQGMVGRSDVAPYGLELAEPNVVIVAHVPPEQSRWVFVHAERATSDAGLAGVLGERLVAIVPGSDADAVARQWKRTLMPTDGSAGPTIVVGGPARNPEALRSAWTDAQQALRLLLALGHGGAATTADHLGLLGLVFGHGEPRELAVYVTRTLGPVLRYDAARGDSKLMDTLQAFFQEGGHLNQTARALGVHINTLYLRLQRLDEQLGSDWRSPDRRLEVHLALRLRDVRERLVLAI
jgi:hypothetical protein